MTMRRLALLTFLSALTSPWAQAAEVTTKAEPMPARLIIRYATPAGASTATLAARADAETARLGAAIGQPLRRLRTLASGAELIDAGAGLDTATQETLAAQIRRSAGARVIAVEPDRLLQATLTPNDPSLSSQWGLGGPTQGNSVAGVNAYPAWDRSDGTGAVVAVIDTGYRPHADLAAQVVAQYDFISDTTSANDGSGRDSNAQDPGDYRDGVVCGGAPASSSSWHGTHVAGTVAALTNNGVGVAGVAYGAKLVIARVLGRCGGYTSDISDAIIWSSGGSVAGIAANPYPANVINMSLGGQYPCSASPEMQNAINSARSRNTTVVVAAGNSNADAGGFSPASCSGVITVAAVGRTGGRAYYSNYGSVVDVAGPGGDASQGTAAQILSTYNTGTTSPGADSYAYLQGTSMATPHVAGVVALMIGLQPSLTPDQVETALKSTARAFPATCSSCGAGIADADQALASLAPGAGRFGFSATAYTVAENGGSATITVQRSGGSAGAVSVNYATANGTATAGSDYTASSGTLNWADGDTAAKTFTVPIINDTAAEAAETIALSLASPAGGATLGAPVTATLSITDDDSARGVLAFATSAYTVAETGGSVVVTVTRTGGSYGTASVSYATANSSALAGSDYVAASGTLTWASGDTANKTIRISVLDDIAAESTEVFQVRLSNAIGATLGATTTAAVSITDNDTVNPAGVIVFSATTYAVNEGGGSATITVRRTGGSVGAVTINYATTNGTALAGSDYTAGSGTLSWAAGDASNKTFTVPITDDALAESSETVLLALSSPGGGATLGSTRNATLTIADNDSSPGVLSLASTSYSVSEAGGSVKISVARTGGTTGAVAVNYATANSSALAGSDYIATSGTLRWASGDATPKTVTITVLNDSIRESAESFQLRLSSPVTAALSGQSYATIAIIDND